jgi:putative ABC transport system permease protein
VRVLWEGARIALAAIWAHKLRSALTLLANIVAVTAVILVASLIAGMDSFVRQEVAGEGTGSFTITRVDPFKILSSYEEFVESFRNPRLQRDDLEYLQERLTLVSHVGAEASSGSRVSTPRRYLDGVRIRGRTREYAETRNWNLDAGRHIATVEMQRGTPVAVIGRDVADGLFPDRSPLDQRIRIRSLHFRVVGVIESQGSVFGQSQDLFVFVPLTAYQKLFGSRQSLDIVARAVDLDRLDEAIEEARFYMRVRHRLRPRDKDDFGILTAEMFVALWKQISGTFFLVIMIVVTISLVVGGIIIMNVMLASVHERTREIGLRKALGATRQAVLYQFLVESVTFSMTGAVFGIGLGLAGAALVAALTPLTYAVKLWAIAAGVVLTLLVGLFFGLYPASRAASLDPIEALRHE